jgi:hypothetical protein
MRAEVIQLLKASPFRPFVIISDSGQQIVVRHPENVPYNPERQTVNCYVVADDVIHIIPWSKITRLAFADTGEPLPTPLH